MKWVTRERVRMDRVACAWLIRNFIDKDAEFQFVSPQEAPQHVRRDDAIPFVLPGAELARKGERITLDAMLDKYGSTDPALPKLPGILRPAAIRAAAIGA